jgi:hypothetical protein
LPEKVSRRFVRRRPKREFHRLAWPPLKPTTPEFQRRIGLLSRGILQKRRRTHVPRGSILVGRVATVTSSLWCADSAARLQEARTRLVAYLPTEGRDLEHVLPERVLRRTRLDFPTGQEGCPGAGEKPTRWALAAAPLAPSGNDRF